MENNKKTNWRETEEKLAQLLQDAESKKNYAYEVIGQIKKTTQFMSGRMDNHWVSAFSNYKFLGGENYEGNRSPRHV